MSKSSEQVAKIIEAAEQAAYKRGWDDCRAAINDAAAKVKSPPTERPATVERKAPEPEAPLKRRLPTKKGKRHRRGSAEGYVTSVIGQHPGIRGTQIAQELDGKVNKHTVRTVLRRASKAQTIEQHGEGWYLKGAYRQAA